MLQLEMYQMTTIYSASIPISSKRWIKESYTSGTIKITRMVARVTNT